MRNANNCGGPTDVAYTAFYTVTVNSIPLIKGSGTLSGRTAFDIASPANSNSECGNISGRYRSDFTQEFSYKQTYTFTKSTTGTVKNVRYIITDPEGLLQPSVALTGTLEPNTMNVASLPLVLLFKTNLNEEGATPKIWGRTYDAAAKIVINIIYDNGSDDVALDPMTVRVQDCCVCRALTTNNAGSTVYRSFMCFDLGVSNWSQDPFVVSEAQVGTVYEYGRPKAATQGDYNNTSPPTTAWGISSGNASSVGAGSTTKGSNDPCPSGWRVPNRNEMEYLKNNNTKRNVTGISGFPGAMFGDALLFGYFGYYSGSTTRKAYKSEAWLWSTQARTNNKAYDLAVSNSNVWINDSNRHAAENVRCISE